MKNETERTTSSYVYLIRHAQAGSRDDYDLLSEVGLRQARLLGEHLAAEGLSFDAIYSGSLRRHAQTAEIALQYLSRSAPEILIDARWDEFDLSALYRAFAPRLMREDPNFARDYEEMEKLLRRDPHMTRGAVGRSDSAIIRAWIEGRYPDYAGESWASFSARIRSCISEARGRMAVFTSATPIAVIVGAALDLSNEKLLSILGVIYNAGISIVRRRGEDLRLFTFNSASHLPPEFRTFR
jgi:broad specificity phosphatase PhoE